MSTVLLVRHAENDHVRSGTLAGRLPGIHLNEKGRLQAAVLAEKLASAPIRAVYSSPLERTMETAQMIALPLGLPVVPRQALLEMDYGEWQGKKIKDLHRLKLWRLVQASPSKVRFPGGESFTEAQQRICREIEILCKQHASKELFVCVTHADPIKLAVAHSIGMPLDLFQRLAVSPASITALNIKDASPSLLFLNVDLSFSFSKS